MDIEWRRASECSSGAEVGVDDGRVLVRDSKHPHREALAFTALQWEVNILRPVEIGSLPSTAVRLASGGVGLSGVDVDGEPRGLNFTADEWSAFAAGAAAGEFDVEVLPR